MVDAAARDVSGINAKRLPVRRGLRVTRARRKQGNQYCDG